MEVAIKKRDKLNIFGNDYNTHDGTCIRDYIHVNDLSIAHIEAMHYIVKQNKNIKLNLATGNGYSIFEVLNATEEIIRQKINYEIVSRRPGDPDELVSKSNASKLILNWEPKFSSIDTILNSMWSFYNSNKTII